MEQTIPGSGFIKLPRGGFLIETSEGSIQIGSPPETIKDTMNLPGGTPQLFVLPRQFFHVEKGISVAELEFPIYYNFFFRKKKTYILCSPAQKEQLTTVLIESLIGPKDLKLESEYSKGIDTHGFPDLQKEMSFFKGYSSLEEVVEFFVFENGIYNYGQVQIKLNEEGFIFSDNGKTTTVPGDIDFNIKYGIGERLEQPFQAPLFGVTCLGPSHGFDPEDNTSGFIIWLNHRGIMVDPPVNSTEWLKESNVNPKLIESVILTHCHADHDAGTFQKIMEETKIRIYTTTTVMDSFLKKYSALTQISRRTLTQMFDFIPVIMGKPTYIYGGEFHFYYALHSIPSMGFQFFFHDQSFLYTSDHLNDPEVHEEMYKKGIFPQSRYRFLKNFPWERNIIYHEAGVPPLHTKISYLASLPEDVQSRITVYHIAKKDMPNNTKLTLAKFGIENTIYPPITPPKNQEAYNILHVLASVDIFADYPIYKAKEFLRIVKEEKFKRGEIIFKKGDPGDRFFIITSGNVRFDGLSNSKDPNNIKVYGTYEYFGEASIVLNQPRAADAVAETDVTALTIEKFLFLQFINGSSLEEKIIKLTSIRDTNSWDVLTKSKLFRSLTSYQITQLEWIMELVHIPEKTIIQNELEVQDYGYIIKTGSVYVLSGETKVLELGQGDFLGELFTLEKRLPCSYKFMANGNVEAYRISQKKLLDYIKQNPGVYMRLSSINL
jgi:CRP-like cAMP-binding protein